MTHPPDHDRFLALLDSHKKILYKVAYTYCKGSEDRRDLMQEMVVQLWKSFDGFDGRVQFATWMYKVAMNVAISFWRSEERRIRDTLPLEDFGLDIAAADQVFEDAGDNMAPHLAARLRGSGGFRMVVDSVAGRDMRDAQDFLARLARFEQGV